MRYIVVMRCRKMEQEIMSQDGDEPHSKEGVLELSDFTCRPPYVTMVIIDQHIIPLLIFPAWVSHTNHMKKWAG